MFEKAFEPIARDLREAQEVFRAFQGFDGLAAPSKTARPTAAGKPRSVYEQMAVEIAGRPGKWMRPGLFLLATRAAAGDGPSACRPGAGLPRKHLLVAAALEMVQNASLLHDDVLDGAALRRHRATANARWGNRAAVLFGDFLIATAFQLVTEAEMPRAFPALASILSSLCSGEILQETLGASPLRVTAEDALKVATRKTASFVAEVCGLGFAGGGGPHAAIEALRRYGLHFGLAYQIMDDVVDIVGVEKKEGKTLRTDLVLARPTLALAYLLQRAPEKARRLVPPCGEAAVAELAALMVRTGAVSCAMAEAETNLSRAKAALAKAAALTPDRLHGLEEAFGALLDALAERRRSLAAVGATASPSGLVGGPSRSANNCRAGRPAYNVRPRLKPPIRPRSGRP